MSGAYLDEDMSQDAGCDAGSHRSHEYREHDHDKRSEGFGEVGEVNVLEALDHDEADEDESRASCGIRNHQNCRRKEHCDEEEDTGRDSGQTSPSAGLDAGRRFDIGCDRGAAEDGADAGADGIDEEGLLDAGQVAVFIEPAAALTQAQHSSQSREEVAEEGNEDEDDSFGCPDMGDIELHDDVADLREVRKSSEGGRNGGDTHRDADDGCDDDADEDGTLDFIGSQQRNDGKADQSQDDSGTCEVAHAQAAVERCQAGVFETEIGDEEADRGGNGNLDVFRNDADDQIPDSQDGENKEDDAFNEDDAHRLREGDGTCLNHAAEQEVAAHAGGEGERHVGVESYQYRDQARNQ